MFKTVYHDVFPVVMERYPDKVHFIFRQQIQPWHPSSTLVHEAGLAVARLAPERFYPFSDALFEKQTDYFDVEVVNEPRNRTYERLAKLGAGVGVDEKKLLELLRVDGKPAPDGGLNIGNKVTDDLKLLVKVCLALCPTSRWQTRGSLADRRRKCRPTGSSEFMSRRR